MLSMTAQLLRLGRSFSPSLHLCLTLSLGSFVLAGLSRGLP